MSGKKQRITSRFGNVDASDLFPSDDPVQDWLTNVKQREDLAPRTFETLEDIIRANGNGTGLQQFLNEHRDVGVLEAGLSDMFAYNKFLEEDGHSERAIRNKFVEASTFYTDLMDFGQTDANPAGLAVQRLDFDPSSPDRVKISVERMGEFLRFIPDPAFRSVVLMALKYGVRRGVPLNVDLQCLHLDHPRYNELLDELGVELKENVRDRPDSILFYEGFNENEMVEGEVRKNGSRRSFGTIFPIDIEMKHSILEWLTMRPRTDGPPYPLYTSRKPHHGAYRRLHGGTLYNHVIEKWSTDFGFTDEDSHREDVDIHYFRHFFRTQMKRHWGDHDGWIDDGLMRYIRGDEEAKPLEFYQHNHWGVNTRDPYLENIYQFGIYD